MKHAAIWKPYINNYENILKEGKIYNINNFAVKPYEKMRCVRSPNQISFTNYTKVQRITGAEYEKKISDNKFDFFDLGDIAESKTRIENDDLIGMYTPYTFILNIYIFFNFGN